MQQKLRYGGYQPVCGHNPRYVNISTLETSKAQHFIKIYKKTKSFCHSSM